MHIADQIAQLMNEMLAADAQAVHRLINTRVRCNRALAAHPTIQVATIEGGHYTNHEVGMLGVLNGIAGLDRRVVACVDDVTLQILRFEARDWPEDAHVG